MLCYLYDENNVSSGQVECQLDPLESQAAGRKVYLLPAQATFIKPPTNIPVGKAAVWNGTAWTLHEDHRQKRDAGGVLIEGSGTAYWLPSDDWQSPARSMTTLGALPTGAQTTRPAKPLDVLKQDKLAAIATAYETVLAYILSPESHGEIAAALAVADFAADDPEGLAFIRAQLKTRRADLEAAVNAAPDAAAVEAVNIGFAV
jgi:hypothetical protein